MRLRINKSIRGWKDNPKIAESDRRVEAGDLVGVMVACGGQKKKLKNNILIRPNSKFGLLIVLSLCGWSSELSTW